MAQTLDAPVYEVKQDSEWYIETKARNKRQDEFFKEINTTYFEDRGFAYYHSEYFGVDKRSKDYEKYKDELLKNPDKNGIYIFKKKSKYVPIFKEMIAKVGEKNPFKSHDVFGANNLKQSQWIGDRWFFSVKNEEYIKDPKEEVQSIDYKEYLKVVMDSLNK